MSSELKSIKCLEWCTKLPGLDCHVESPVFLVQGCECSFRFALRSYSYRNWYYVFYVEVKNESSKWKPCDVYVQVGFKSELKLSVATETWEVLQNWSENCWRYEMNQLQKCLPSDYATGNLIKFRVCFPDVTEIFLKVRKETENKGLQTNVYLNTDTPANSLIEDLSKLLDTGEDHDAEIKCGECSIKSHKVILCARSEVFKAMLQSDMVEGRTGIVQIEDMDVTYIKDFVRYLYTEKMPELTFEKAKALYRAADKYAVRSLMLRCSEFFQDNLSVENAFESLALADAHSDEKLIDSIIEFCLERKMYLQDDVWSPFCEKYPKIALKAYRLLHKTDTDRKYV